MVYSDTYKPCWFALQVKCGMEQMTAGLLQSKGFEAFLPSHEQSQSAYGDSTGEPLFPGYLFCRFDPVRRTPVVMTPGVVRVLGFGTTPAPLSESEIEAVRDIVRLAGNAERRKHTNAL
ncbi:MAG TPA: transcription termination/antitermination NusG family protein [Bryobacteraceae bacterium]|nr:transcription termination/antitermination NusG family protein [Bryobacteraceae bacterium]